MNSHKIHICNLYGLHELCGYVFLKILLEKIVCHKIHTCNLCGPHELCGCASSNDVHEKMICHMIHICNLCGHYEWCGCDSLNFSFIPLCTVLVCLFKLPGVENDLSHELHEIFIPR